MSAPVHWMDIPADIAARLPAEVLRNDVVGPLTQERRRCIWPWEPQLLIGKPMGMYHCLYCGEMVLAGIEHVDYTGDPEVLFPAGEGMERLLFDHDEEVYS